MTNYQLMCSKSEELKKLLGHAPLTLEWMLERITEGIDGVNLDYFELDFYTGEYQLHLTTPRKIAFFDKGSDPKIIFLKALHYTMWGKTWNENKGEWEVVK